MPEIILNRSVCIGCGICVSVCPMRVFELYAGEARIVKANLCINCKACEINCPVGAISIRTVG